MQSVAKVVANLFKKLSERGFTMVEVAIALLLVSVLFLGITGMLKSSSTNYKIHQSAVESEQSAYFAMEMIMRDLREASMIITANNGTCQFTDKDNISVTYNWDQQKKEITRTQGVDTEVLAENISNCNYLLTDNGQQRYINIKITAIINGKSVELEDDVSPRY